MKNWFTIHDAYIVISYSYDKMLERVKCSLMHKILIKDNIKWKICSKSSDLYQRIYLFGDGISLRNRRARQLYHLKYRGASHQLIQLICSSFRSSPFPRRTTWTKFASFGSFLNQPICQQLDLKIKTGFFTSAFPQAQQLAPNTHHIRGQARIIPARFDRNIPRLKCKKDLDDGFFNESAERCEVDLWTDRNQAA